VAACCVTVQWLRAAWLYSGCVLRGGTVAACCVAVQWLPTAEAEEEEK